MQSILGGVGHPPPGLAHTHAHLADPPERRPRAYANLAYPGLAARMEKTICGRCQPASTGYYGDCSKLHFLGEIVMSAKEGLDQQVIFFQNAHLIDGTGAAPAEATVVVDGETIKDVIAN